MDRLLTPELKVDLEAYERARDACHQKDDTETQAAKVLFHQQGSDLRTKHSEYVALHNSKMMQPKTHKTSTMEHMIRHIKTLAPLTTVDNNKPWADMVAWAQGTPEYQGIRLSPFIHMCFRL